MEDAPVGRLPQTFRTLTIPRKPAGSESLGRDVLPLLLGRAIREQEPLGVKTEIKGNGPSKQIPPHRERPIGLPKPQRTVRQPKECFVLSLCVYLWRQKEFCPSGVLFTSDFLFEKCYMPYLIHTHKTPQDLWNSLNKSTKSNIKRLLWL